MYLFLETANRTSRNSLAPLSRGLLRVTGRDERHRRRRFASHLSRARLYGRSLQSSPTLPARWRFFRARSPVPGVTAKTSRVFEGVSFQVYPRRQLCRGAVGALLLLSTPEKLSTSSCRWLLLAATLVFIFGPDRSRQHLLASSAAPVPGHSLFSGHLYGVLRRSLGLITLAVWSLFGLTDMKAVNPNKILLGGLTNTAAVACFIARRKIWWTESLVMLAGAVAGGYPERDSDGNWIRVWFGRRDRDQCYGDDCLLSSEDLAWDTHAPGGSIYGEDSHFFSSYS